MVVLYLHELRVASMLDAPAAREIRRVRVDGDRLGNDAVHRTQRRDAAIERLERLKILEIADVLAHPRMGTRRQTERALQLSPDRERRRHLERKRRAGAERSRESGESDA